MTYEDLDRVSNRLARLLISRGVGKRDTVCLCADKLPLTYASIIACLKVGAPYFVVDPANPTVRTRTMLERCRPVVAIVQPSIDRSPFDCPTIEIGNGADAEAALLATFSDAPFEPPVSINGSDPAYVMFTSGSTGVPKGVTISHNNLVNFIYWSRHEFSTSPDDVFTNVNPLFFDNSVFDMYASLFAGATLVPFDAATMRDPKSIAAAIEQMGCTVYFSVPSLLVYLQTLKLVQPASFPALQKIIFGGEGYPKPMLAKLFQTVGDRIALYNVYGPTECTCICSVYRVGAADFADMAGYAPLGRLIRNFSYVIVDENNARVAPGAPGQLCLGGPCVGLGYYRDPMLTASAFIQNPTHHDVFDRMYKTGDLVREDQVDGKIHFVGRADTQIKHQGYRIELGEVEHALTSIDGVDEAAALYLASGATSHIVGVVASARGLTPAAIKSVLRQRIPGYMVPEKIVVTGPLTKNANGKIDRRAIKASLERAEH
jgi:D-alanine--poly(phosphoribitol) ligase subunit 1